MAAALLEKPIEYLKGVGPNRGTLLRNELGIDSVKDLLYHFPNRYIDRTRFYQINELPKVQADVQLIGKISDVRLIQQAKGKRLVAKFKDSTGEIELVWFRGYQWIQKQLQIDINYVAFGRLTWYGSRASIAHPELEEESKDLHKSSAIFQPVYPSTEKLVNRSITNRTMRLIMYNLFEELQRGVRETLSESIRTKHGLIGATEALRTIHFPKNLNELKTLLKKKFVIVGNQRSYNDCFIGYKQKISLTNFNRIINFDKKKKLIEVETGISLKKLNNFLLKNGFMLECMPGCKYVTIGGMIANNTSGKLNIKNNFSNYIQSLKIVDKNLNLLNCSNRRN